MREDGPNQRGKISKVLWFAEEFPEEIEADLQRYYGLDFLDFFRPGSRLGWRKLVVLLEQLPPESALFTAVRNNLPEDELAGEADPSRAPWSMVETLMAVLIDEVRALSWLYASAHSGGKTVPKPSPIMRPGASRRGRRRPFDLATAQRLDPRLRGLSVEDAQEKLNRMLGRESNGS